MRTWSEEQEALLRRIWPTGESLKPYLSQLGDRCYTTITSHAHKLGLGPRAKTARGNPAYAWDAIDAVLKKGTASAPELIDRTGLSMYGVYHAIRAANPGPKGKLHIADWRKRSTGGEPTAVFARGPGKNAPKPAPFTAREKDQMVKARRRAKKNPFATAAGLVAAPVGVSGRVYVQSMDVGDEELAA
ncbi:hypothetical protein [Burkholderia pseudomallei]|uniref:hypothetical protein n=1 Tax=Burkholderia pseudomallei TaxID=28450 RepID=UPI0005E8BF24|nr:hypothetical protein [Burkholderia pseudomallei]MDV2160730.1 hypothetical protein [Burkholderia pseudomallei]MDV2234260.1 hypothetical protein [Burkholderia pseudomallei]QUN94012.1 hypothetical protein KEX44_07795 [Burkholderia pseudomallei]CAK1281917.1 transcriptional regulator [Burkholderia pseudomallei]CAK1319569.1 transcriptional regulator [Burkholderia pseudomallei]